MRRSQLAYLAGLTAILIVTGCFHPGTQERGSVPGREDFSVVPPPPPPPVPRLPPPAAERAAARQPVYLLWHRRLRGVPALIVRIALADVRPEIVFASGGDRPRAATVDFGALLRRTGPAIVSSGAFCGERSHQILGTLISRGQTCQRQLWNRRGTALEIDAHGEGFVSTLRLAKARMHCPFYLQAGPRLVRNGSIWLHPRFEGFADPVLLGRARRVAVGLAHHGRVLLLVAFPEAITLRTEAQGMRDLGCADAMNLDGGSSAALAIGGHVLVEPTTALTHVMVFRFPIRATKAGRSSAPSRAGRSLNPA